MICIHCEGEFTPYPKKPGKINECPNCAVETTARNKGVMIWHGKHSPECVPMPAARATQILKSTRRLGAGVTAGLCPRGAETGNPGTKLGSGMQADATFRTNLGESRRVHSLKRKKN